MKADELFQQIDETLSEARGETVHLTPDQFLAFVQAQTKAMRDEDDVEATIKRAEYLKEVLDLAKNFESNETVSVPMFPGEKVEQQSAWRSHSGLGMGSRGSIASGRPAGFQDSEGGPTVPENTGSSVSMPAGLKAGFIDKAERIKGAIEAFLKATSEDGEGEEPAASDEPTGEEVEATKADKSEDKSDDSKSEQNGWPRNFNSKSDDGDDISFGKDPNFG